MQKLGNPTPTFYDARGALIDGGRIYVGVAGADPETSPIPVYFDKDLTIPASQPLRTIGGYIVNDVVPTSVYLGATDYSMRLADADDVQVFYSASIYTDTDSFQPKDSDLTAIAALATTPFGRALLTLADANALKTATGIPTPLPLAGGTVTGNILRQGAGAYPYWFGATLTGARMFLIEAGAGDPSSALGDIVFEKEA